MKKLIPLFMILMVGLSLAADVTVTRAMPDSIVPSGTLEVKFDIFPSKTVDGFDLADLIPRNWEVADWSVTGVDKSAVSFDTKAQSYGGKVYMANHWKFPAFSAGATLAYTVKVPSTEGSYDFAGIWTFPGGFDSDSKTLSITTAAAPAEPTPSEPIPTEPEQTEPAEPVPTEPTPTEAPGVPTWVYGLVILLILAAAYYYFTNQKPAGKPGPKYAKVKKVRLD